MDADPDETDTLQCRFVDREEDFIGSEQTIRHTLVFRRTVRDGNQTTETASSSAVAGVSEVTESTSEKYQALDSSGQMFDTAIQTVHQLSVHADDSDDKMFVGQNIEESDDSAFAQDVVETEITVTADSSGAAASDISKIQQESDKTGDDCLTAPDVRPLAPSFGYPEAGESSLHCVDREEDFIGLEERQQVTFTVYQRLVKSTQEQEFECADKSGGDSDLKTELTEEGSESKIATETSDVSYSVGVIQTGAVDTVHLTGTELSATGDGGEKVGATEKLEILEAAGAAASDVIGRVKHEAGETDAEGLSSPDERHLTSLLDQPEAGESSLRFVDREEDFLDTEERPQVTFTVYQRLVKNTQEQEFEYAYKSGGDSGLKIELAKGSSASKIATETSDASFSVGVIQTGAVDTVHLTGTELSSTGDSGENVGAIEKLEEISRVKHESGETDIEGLAAPDKCHMTPSLGQPDAEEPGLRFVDREEDFIGIEERPHVSFAVYQRLVKSTREQEFDCADRTGGDSGLKQKLTEAGSEFTENKDTTETSDASCSVDVFSIGDADTVRLADVEISAAGNSSETVGATDNFTMPEEERDRDEIVGATEKFAISQTGDSDTRDVFAGPPDSAAGTTTETDVTGVGRMGFVDRGEHFVVSSEARPQVSYSSFLHVFVNRNRPPSQTNQGAYNNEIAVFGRPAGADDSAVTRVVEGNAGEEAVLLSDTRPGSIKGDGRAVPFSGKDADVRAELTADGVAVDRTVRASGEAGASFAESFGYYPLDVGGKTEADATHVEASHAVTTKFSSVEREEQFVASWERPKISYTSVLIVPIRRKYTRGVGGTADSTVTEGTEDTDDGSSNTVTVSEAAYSVKTREVMDVIVNRAVTDSSSRVLETGEASRTLDVSTGIEEQRDESGQADRIADTVVTEEGKVYHKTDIAVDEDDRGDITERIVHEATAKDDALDVEQETGAGDQLEDCVEFDGVKPEADSESLRVSDDLSEALSSDVAGAEDSVLQVRDDQTLYPDITTNSCDFSEGVVLEEPTEDIRICYVDRREQFFGLEEQPRVSFIAYRRGVGDGRKQGPDTSGIADSRALGSTDVTADVSNITAEERTESAETNKDKDSAGGGEERSLETAPAASAEEASVDISEEAVQEDTTNDAEDSAASSSEDRRDLKAPDAASLTGGRSSDFAQSVEGRSIAFSDTTAAEQTAEGENADFSDSAAGESFIAPDSPDSVDIAATATAGQSVLLDVADVSRPPASDVSEVSVPEISEDYDEEENGYEDDFEEEESEEEDEEENVQDENVDEQDDEEEAEEEEEEEEEDIKEENEKEEDDEEERDEEQLPSTESGSAYTEDAFSSDIVGATNVVTTDQIITETDEKLSERESESVVTLEKEGTAEDGEKASKAYFSTERVSESLIESVDDTTVTRVAEAETTTSSKTEDVGGSLRLISADKDAEQDVDTETVTSFKRESVSGEVVYTTEEASTDRLLVGDTIDEGSFINDEGGDADSDNDVSDAGEEFDDLDLFADLPGGDTKDDNGGDREVAETVDDKGATGDAGDNLDNLPETENGATTYDKGVIAEKTSTDRLLAGDTIDECSFIKDDRGDADSDNDASDAGKEFDDLDLFADLPGGDTKDDSSGDKEGAETADDKGATSDTGDNLDNLPETENSATTSHDKDAIAEVGDNLFDTVEPAGDEVEQAGLEYDRDIEVASGFGVDVGAKVLHGILQSVDVDHANLVDVSGSPEEVQNLKITTEEESLGGAVRGDDTADDQDDGAVDAGDEFQIDLFPSEPEVVDTSSSVDESNEGDANPFASDRDETEDVGAEEVLADDTDEVSIEDVHVDISTEVDSSVGRGEIAADIPDSTASVENIFADQGGPETVVDVRGTAGQTSEQLESGHEESEGENNEERTGIDEEGSGVEDSGDRKSEEKVSEARDIGDEATEEEDFGDKMTEEEVDYRDTDDEPAAEEDAGDEKSDEEVAAIRDTVRDALEKDLGDKDVDVKDTGDVDAKGEDYSEEKSEEEAVDVKDSDEKVAQETDFGDEESEEKGVGVKNAGEEDAEEKYYSEEKSEEKVVDVKDTGDEGENDFGDEEKGGDARDNVGEDAEEGYIDEKSEEKVVDFKYTGDEEAEEGDYAEEKSEESVADVKDTGYGAEEEGLGGKKIEENIEEVKYTGDEDAPEEGFGDEKMEEEVEDLGNVGDEAKEEEDVGDEKREEEEGFDDEKIGEKVKDFRGKAEEDVDDEKSEEKVDIGDSGEKSEEEEDIGDEKIVEKVEDLGDLGDKLEKEKGVSDEKTKGKDARDSGDEAREEEDFGDEKSEEKGEDLGDSGDEAEEEEDVVSEKSGEKVEAVKDSGGEAEEEQDFGDDKSEEKAEEVRDSDDEAREEGGVGDEKCEEQVEDVKNAGEEAAEDENLSDEKSEENVLDVRDADYEVAEDEDLGDEKSGENIVDVTGVDDVVSEEVDAGGKESEEEVVEGSATVRLGAGEEGIEREVSEYETFECSVVEREEQFEDLSQRPRIQRTDHYDLTDASPAGQRLLEDIKSNRARAAVVLEEHASLRDRTGETTPSQGNRLLKEIGQLEEAAEYQCGELRAAVSEQEQYETEIRHLNAAISEAQQQLLASPVQASTVEALKQQIAEHNQEAVSGAEEPRARSSSFGQKVEPLGRPLGTAPEVAELNASWNSLQKQVAAKEKELQHALKKQERYQQAVQELTAKMERAQIRLARTPASAASDVNTQMKEYKETLAELETIREDITRVRERGRQIMEVSDAEGHKAMEATLTMLTDRITSLQTVADNKGKQLQDLMKHRKKHDIELTAYKKRVSDMESWLGEMKVRHATTPLPTDDPAAIQQQLQENRDLQEELNRHLQHISDLAVQCDNLCEMEPPAEAEKLRNQLAGLQSRLGNFKLITIEKQNTLRNTVKDSEKRRKEMEDYESSVAKLQQWMTDTKQMTMHAGGVPATVTMPDHQQLQQQLESDLSRHRQLVRQLSTTATIQRPSEGASAAAEMRMLTMPTLSETELHSNWQSLQRDLALKTEELEKLIRKRKAGETVTSTAGNVGDTARQLHEVQGLVAQLALCWQQLQVQVDDKQLRLDTALAFQEQMQSTLTAMSSWLDMAEQIVLSPSSGSQSQHDRIRQNEALQRELRSLQSEITTLTSQAQDLLSDASVQSHGLIQESLTNLNQRVTMLENQAVSRGDELRHAQHQWQQYHDDVRTLRARMQELQTSIMVPPPTATTNLDALVSSVNKLETQLKKCESQLDELKARETELSAHHPRGVVPSELSTLCNSYMELQRKVGERKASLLQSVSVQEQYEKMLKDYADFLETAEGKLRTEAISARDLPHLQQQLSAHKEFFSDLEVHKAMLDSLASQCDPATQDTHSMQHTRLSNLTHVLADQASLHGQRLERLVRQWNSLDDKLSHLQGFLTQVEDGIPKPIASGDSLATIQEKLAKFKRLQGQLADERPTVFQAVDRGKQILHSVACPALETAVTELADKWVELNTRLIHELKKTETIGEQLQIFEAEAMVLKMWMSTAQMKLEDLKHLSEEDMTNIGNIRAKVEHILEFRKEVQNQLPLKAKVMSVGKQLMANRNYDTRGLDTRLAAIEEEWGQLEQAITMAEQSLHQAQMELMPSRQALHELQMWMEEIEKALKVDGNSPIKTQADIEILLNKYKGYKIELASKQLTMDFVNQSVLQPGPHEIDVPHEKLEFSEKLAELNQHWAKVSADINERLRSLEQLSGKWAEYEAALAQLQSWFRQQEDKIKRYRLIGHEVGVKQTLKDCKMMHEQLHARTEDMESIKSLGQSLIELSRESPGCQRSIRESLDVLSQQWDHLQQQTMQLESLLTDMLGQWARYHADLHSLSQVIAQTEYTLNRYSLVGADMPSLISQVNKLKSLEAELKQHSSHLDSFATLANQLCQVCEPPVQAEVKATVADLKTKWWKLSADLSTRRAEFERCLSKWREYEQEYQKICDWLAQKEEECNGLVAMREDVAARQECLEKSEVLQQELDEIQTQLSTLYRLSDDLTKNMGTSTIVLLTSRQSAVEQRLLALRQLLLQHIQTLHEDLSQVNRFREAFAAVRTFLDHAEAVLSPEDPNRSSEQPALQRRLDQLKQLSAQFQANSDKLDEVNDLGYRLALDASDSSQLLDLNHTWYRLLADCQERCKTLQAHLLVQQDFTAKCETWMTFLATTEHDLSTEIAGNLADLLEQQRKCQKFESEMYSNQQVLHAIISDGQKMMRAGEVEDPREFEQKLRLLNEQWQSVIRRATQRKNIIDTTIQNWHLFNTLNQQLRRWLNEKEQGLKMFEFETISLQQIRTLLDRVKMIQSEFKMQEESFRKVHDLGSILLQRADSTASEEIKICTAQLQHGWLKVYNQLEEHRARLEVLQGDWRECEEDIEDILTWLKNIRQMLNADIPNTYDDLQADLARCKDIATSFHNSEDKLQKLLAREKKLSRVIQAEDMNVLRQRIRLLNKQWDELASQAGLREHRLHDSTFRWSNLGEEIRALMDWIDDMEVKIVSSREVHVEDLLAKLETDYQDAMTMKAREIEEVVARGQQLMKNSSEVRASDIEQRLQRLQDKWTHLKAVADFRKHKLQETVLAVKQLDTNMRNLSHWLATVEQELNSPVVFNDTDMQEIHSKLQHTQEIQRDIEHHSAGVSSVLNLCEVLLHDSDACPTETEFNALHHAMKNLDRRWKNICNLCPERRAWIKETWELWEAFHTDCKRFSEWLSEMELEVGESEANQPPTVTKEDVRRYEALQRRVLDHLSDLESLTKQYRHLAKEGRTDTKGLLRTNVQEASDRWDALQQRLADIMQGLKHSAGIREDFITTRLSLMQWLTEVDMQLTNIEHLSQMDINTKIKEIQRIEEEIDDRRHRMDYLNQAAILLVQQGSNEEAIKIQQELDEFKIFSRQVLDRVSECQAKLRRISAARVEDIAKAEERESRYMPSSERSTDILVGQRPGTEWDTHELEAYLESSPPESPPHKRRAGAAGVDLPQASVSPMRRSMSPARRSLSPMRRSASPTRRSSSPSRWSKDVVDSGKLEEERWQSVRRERSAKIEVLLEQLADAIKEACSRLDIAERQMQSYSASDSSASHKQLQSLVECETQIDKVQRLDRLLKLETGTTTIPSADHQIANVLERWQRLQSLAAERDLRLSQQQHDLVKFQSDLESLLAWLDEAEALQASHDQLPSDISQLNIIIRQHKDFMMHLESKRARVLSIQLLSKNYINTKTAEGRYLSNQVQELNRRWETVTAQAADTQRTLQGALLQCQEFHHTVHDYLLWLEGAEVKLRHCEPVRLSADNAALWAKYNTLRELRRELEANQPAVLSLRETADQLLVSGELQEMAAARDKTHIIANRLRSLLHLTAAYLESLERKLDIRPSGVDTREGRLPTVVHPSLRTRTRSPFALLRRLLFGEQPISLPADRPDSANLTTEHESTPIPSVSYRCRPRRPLLYRVLRTALPLQLFLLLLLGIACLVPLCEDDYSCLLANNLRHSLAPMLRYTDGAPPT